MKQPIFKGAATAIITPFTESGINYEVFEELIEYQISNGIDCIVVCGTTGEASTMPDDEHKAAIKFCVDKVNGRVPVIAGAGSNDTNHAIELSRYAESVHADGILSVSPYYNKTTQNGLFQHFKAIADSVDIPIVLYNVPSRTGMNINPETQRRLSELKNIAGVKECNLLQVTEVKRICPEDLAVYSGEDGMVVPMLSLGGLGVISVASNIVPRKMHDLVQFYLDGNVVESRKLQIELLDLINALFIEVNPMPVKTALSLMGRNVGKCRLPLVEMEEKNVEHLKVIMKKHKLI
ncbi:MAG: 4-hydroxy-tetrahydrodipicolinate synthase [Eubacteriales bacterium]|nr:4-hydroxy-tetrahydrodipicolinate synthase [Eubacteriales bacterium]